MKVFDIINFAIFILQIVCKYSLAKCAFQKQNLALFYYMSYIRQRNKDKMLTQIELNLYNKNTQIPKKQKHVHSTCF